MRFCLGPVWKGHAPGFAKGSFEQLCTLEALSGRLEDDGMGSEKHEIATAFADRSGGPES